jgi:hypothetical protein
VTGPAYLRPPRAARTTGAQTARLFRPSNLCPRSAPTRNTQRWRSTPVVMLNHDGARYLSSVYSDTEWSRNLRPAGAGRLSRGHVEAFTAVEAPLGQRPELTEAYLHAFGNVPRWGGRSARCPTGGPSDISHAQREPAH